MQKYTVIEELQDELKWEKQKHKKELKELDKEFDKELKARKQELKKELKVLKKREQERAQNSKIESAKKMRADGFTLDAIKKYLDLTDSQLAKAGLC